MSGFFSPHPMKIQKQRCEWVPQGAHLPFAGRCSSHHQIFKNSTQLTAHLVKRAAHSCDLQATLSSLRQTEKLSPLLNDLGGQ